MNKKPKKFKKTVFIIAAILVLVGLGVGLFFRQNYYQNLKPVNTNDNKSVVVAIPAGSALFDIAQNLKTQGVIRSQWAFIQYVKTHRLADKLKAGTYRLNTSQSVQSIVDDIVNSRVASGLFTILPGQRLDQLKTAFLKAGFDPTAVETAFNPDTYSGHPALADKPNQANLEGYLYPDSYERLVETTPSTIVRQSLDQMAKYLTPVLKAAYKQLGLTTHQAVTLASVVEREVNGQTDRATAAQVFLTRIKNGMRLESDVTVLYGMVLAGKDTKYVDTKFDSPYNTFLRDGFPVGPISNVTASSLQAVAEPSKTDFIYFVAGDGPDYGKTYFSRTLAEHQAAIVAHCRSCSQ